MIFYLTNQHVSFKINNQKCVHYNRIGFYMIIFDGQVQLAEKSNVALN